MSPERNTNKDLIPSYGCNYGNNLSFNDKMILLVFNLIEIKKGKQI
jgi:hypothetical protein